MVGDPIPYRTTTHGWKIECNYSNCDWSRVSLDKDQVQQWYRQHADSHEQQLKKLKVAKSEATVKAA